MKTKILHVKLPEVVWKALSSVAKKDGSTTSQIVRAILCRSLKLKRSLAVMPMGPPTKG